MGGVIQIKVMGRSRYKIYEEHYPYFITSTARDGIPLFSIPVIAEIILDNLNYLQNKRAITVYGYVIMENHFHVVVEGKDLAENIRLTKSFMGRKILDTLKELNKSRYLKYLRFRKLKHKLNSDYQVFEEGFHPKQITSEKMMIQKLEYIHFNPVTRGYVDRPEDWRYSSARNYNGKEGLIPVSIFTR